MRNVLAVAAVKGFFRKDERKFLKVAKEVPSFSSDLLGAVDTGILKFVSGVHGYNQVHTSMQEAHSYGVVY